MGSSKKPEQQVADYMMSMHFGVCHEADSIERIKINDKVESIVMPITLLDMCDITPINPNHLHKYSLKGSIICS